MQIVNNVNSLTGLTGVKENRESFLEINTGVLLNKATDWLTVNGYSHEIHASRTLGKSRHKAEILLKDFQLDDGQGSPMHAKITLLNANDGSRAFCLGVGFLRMVCSNGLMVGTSFFNERIIHRNSANTIERVEQLPFKIAAAVDYIATGIMDSVYELRDIQLTDGQAIQVIGNLPVHEQVKRQAIAVWLGSKTRRVEDSPNNAWSLFNIVQENLRWGYGRTTLAYESVNSALMEHVLILGEAA